jgi:hypothetical protein
MVDYYDIVCHYYYYYIIIVIVIIIIIIHIINCYSYYYVIVIILIVNNKIVIKSLLLFLLLLLLFINYCYKLFLKSCPSCGAMGRANISHATDDNDDLDGSIKIKQQLAFIRWFRDHRFY